MKNRRLPSFKVCRPDAHPGSLLDGYTIATSYHDPPSDITFVHHCSFCKAFATRSWRNGVKNYTRNTYHPRGSHGDQSRYILLDRDILYAIVKNTQSSTRKSRIDTLTLVQFAMKYSRNPQMSSISVDPNSKPPSYSFLGILLSIRLLHRLYSILHPYFPSTLLSSSSSTSASEPPSAETFIDSTPISVLVPSPAQLANAVEDPWGDRTILDLDTITPELRVSQRKCALCLEERTASSVTECGHVFCWTCVVGWAREKVRGKPQVVIILSTTVLLTVLRV